MVPNWNLGKSFPRYRYLARSLTRHRTTFSGIGIRRASCPQSADHENYRRHLQR